MGKTQPTNSNLPPVNMARNLAVLLTAAIVICGISSTLQGVSAGWWLESPAIHALIRGVGVMLMVGLAAMILVLQRNGRLTASYTWAAASLAAMGVMNAFLALTVHERMLIWLQAGQMALCGVTFAGVLLPANWSSGSRVSRLIVSLMAALAVAFCSLSLTFLSNHVERLYSLELAQTALLLNGIGTVGYFVSAACFLFRHSTERRDSVLFANTCLVLGLAACLFDYQLVWSGSWWFVSGLSLLATSILAGHFLSYFHRVHQELIDARNNLEKQVLQRTRSLREQMEERHRIEQELLMTNMALKRKATDLHGSRIATLNMMQDIDAARRKAEAAEQTLRGMVDELLQMKDKAEASSRSKSEFLANMSHEIRTPMTAILGYAEILKGQIGEEGAGAEAVETIRRNGEFLLRILNDILDLSKIESGKMEVERIRTTVSQIVFETLSLMRIRARSKNLTLDVSVDSPIPEVIETDPTRLRQILVNLVANAIKFTEVGSVSIKISGVKLDSDQPQIEFKVIDTGIGMTEDQMGRLFQSFSQADSSLSRRFGGTGLGLAISQRLAEKLGGNINVVSTYGSGSVFTLTIPTGRLPNVPLVNEVREQEAEPIRSEKELPRLNCRILMVEDGADNQRLIGFLLRKAGAQVTIVENGFEAVQKLIYNDGTADFDLVLMDMQMPVMDGYEATARLREAGYHKPVIAMTAHAMRGDRQKCLDAGCSDYLQKPVDRKTLISMVADYAGRVPKAVGGDLPSARESAPADAESESHVQHTAEADHH